MFTVCVALILCFLTIEITVRMTHLFNARLSWTQPHEVLGWSFIPNGTFWFREENPNSVTFKTNSYGWKDKEWSIRKPKNTFRIAALGDSYAEAFQVEPEKNFLSLAENKLPGTEWLNFSRSGFTQTEELWVLKNEALRFSPDLVIVFFFAVNDIDDISKKTALDPIRPFYQLSTDNELILDTSFKDTSLFKRKSFLFPFKKHSVVLSLIAERWSLLKRQNSFKLRAQTGKLQGYLTLCTQSPDPVYAENYKLNKHLLSEMIKVSKQNRTGFLLVNIDTPAYMPQIEESFKKVSPDFDPLFFEKDLEQFAQNQQVYYLSLQSLFREKFSQTGHALHWEYWLQKNRPYWEYGAHTGHWNYQGHEVVAEAISQKVAEILARAN